MADFDGFKKFFTGKDKKTLGECAFCKEKILIVYRERATNIDSSFSYF